ncbi:hypothetical protein ACFL6M_02915 [Candidatus Eisenbacteria bacterium]|uniref:Uncharacterized protein n=1 Tax=Eiseniibacteriota bacterium TaxID=2212470 RepID=A0ABV6YK24_UNCEI
MARIVLAVLVAMELSGNCAWADWPSTAAEAPLKDNSHVAGVPVGGDHVAGDIIEQAWVVDGLPFTGTGNTCLFNDDYDQACPYSGSVSPDVVYAFAPIGDVLLLGDLCDGYPYSYDTKLYIYEDAEGNLVACDDDLCGSAQGYASYIYNVELLTGHVYYIVVDGFGGDCGNYLLKLYEGVPCELDCTGAIPEGEPECYTDYVDLYNAGCNGVPYQFQEVLPCGGEPITYCGTAGVYYFGTTLRRDTDWYQLTTSAPEVISWTVESNVRFNFYIMDGTFGCSTAFIAVATTTPCEPYTFTDVQLLFPGAYWFWVGAPGWDPVAFPCDGSFYKWTIEGFTGDATPLQDTRWGTIKSMFR